MAYLGKTPSQAVRSRFYFTASGGETSLAPAQVTGLSFTDANYVDVSLNGVALVSGTDYTATPSTNTISSLAALTASDVVEIVVYDTFSVFGGSVNGDFTISNGTLAAEAVTVTGLTTTGNINFGDNDRAFFGAGNDFEIFHDGSNTYLAESGGTGNVYLRANNLVLLNNSNETYVDCVSDGAVTLYHNNSVKIATTSTGVDVTGNVGVNTASPAYTIDAASSGNTQIHLKASGQADGLEVGQLSADGGSAIIATNNNYLKFGTNNTERLRITNGGNVGIGTSSPATKLSLVSDGAGGDIHVKNGSGQNALLELAGNNNTCGSTSALFGQDASSNAYAWQRANAPLLLGTNNTERMRILSDGKVGVNCTPDATFKVVSSGANLIVGFNGTQNYFDASENIFRNFAGSERMRITSAGLVGIGTSSPSTALHVEGANGDLLTVKGASGSEFAMRVDGNEISFKADADNDEADSVMTFDVDGSERMRINSSGNLLIGKTSDSIANTGISAAGSATGGGHLSVTNNTSAAFALNRGDSNGQIATFSRAASVVGNISVTTSSTAYNTSSDYRLKEAVVDMTGAIDRVKALAPKRFNFIADADTTVDGFLAHEAQAVVPEAVTGTHNEVDDDGNAVMQGIDQSKLVPLLTGALREAITKIETLETQRADLETRLTALENAE